MPIRLAYQIISRTDGSEKGLPFGRHFFKQFWMRIPIVPLAIDGVVTAENREAVVFLIRPRVRAMCQRFREKEERTGGTLVGIPNQRILASDCFGCCVDGFMARRNKESAALPIFDGIQFPNDAG